MTALPLSEAAWQERVIAYAVARRWRVAHVLPSVLRGRHLTATTPHPGLPDLILARAGTVLLAELKSQTGRPSVAQKAWLAALDGHGRLWRPTDWPQVVETLR